MWSQVKAFAASTVNLFVKRDEINNDELADDIIRYIRDKHKYFILTYRHFSYIHSFLPKIGKYGKLGVEIFDNTVMLIFVNKKPILYITTTGNKKADGSGEKSAAHFLSVRGTFSVEEFVANSVECRNYKDWHYTDQNSSRFTIKNYPNIYKNAQNGISTNSNFKLWSNKLIKFNEEDLIFPRTITNNIDRLVFDKSVYDNIKSIELWLKYKDWYKEKGIPWKTGWLLHGQGGTGKSSTALGLAQKYDLPIFVYRLGLLSSQEFTKNWREMQSSVPCIALIEDFDNVFNKRENISGYKNYITGFGTARIMPNKNNNSPQAVGDDDFGVETELTFDTLLNTLDGVERYEGTMVIITTNDLSKVDAALYARPGRIDKVIELDCISKENMVKMAKSIIGEEWGRFISDNELNKRDWTPAQWQEWLISIALTNLYKESENGE